MVSRIEIALFVLLLGALMLGLSNRSQIVEAHRKESEIHKSAELYDALNLEVNSSGVMNLYSARHAYLVGESWYMEDFRTKNPDIRYLGALEALRTKGMTRLEGNVTLMRKDGSVYRAKTVIYDRVQKILRCIGPFDAYRGEDWIRGINFRYEIAPKITRASAVYAHYRLNERRALGSSDKMEASKDIKE